MKKIVLIVLVVLGVSTYCFGQFISVGNKADVNENDLLEYWQSCNDVKVLTYYLESFVDG